MDTTYQLVLDFASISWNKARTQKFHPFPWHFLTPFRHFFGDCYIVLLNQGGCATISCWDDHKAYQKLSPWLVVAVCSHRFLYIPIRSKMHICTYIYIHIYTYTYYIYMCVSPIYSHVFQYVPCIFPHFCVLTVASGFNKTDLVAPSSGFRTLKRKNGGRSSKIPLRRLGRRGHPKIEHWKVRIHP